MKTIDKREKFQYNKQVWSGRRIEGRYGMNFWFYGTVYVLGLVILVCLIILLWMSIRHDFELSRFIRYYKRAEHPDKLILADARFAVNRSVSCISRYRRVRLWHQVTRVLSLLLAIAVLILGTQDRTGVPAAEVKSTILSLLAVIFLALALFLAPGNRNERYKKAAGQYGFCVMALTGGLMNHSDFVRQMLQLEEDLLLGEAD